MTGTVSDERLEELERHYLMPDPHDEVGKCLDCDTLLALRELRSARAELSALRAENERLREALREYGKHDGYCDYHSDARKCTCGLRAAIAQESKT